MGFFDWLPIPEMDWKAVASIAVGTVAFVGLTVVTGGLGAPLLATLLVAGAGSGVAGQLVYDWLDGRKPGVDVLYAGVVSAGLTLVGAGVGRAVGPMIGGLLQKTGIPQAIARSPVGQLLTRTAGEAEGTVAAKVGEVLGAGKQTNPKFGQPQLLDPKFFDPPGVPRPAPRVTAPVAPSRTGGFVSRLPQPD